MALVDECTVLAVGTSMLGVFTDDPIQSPGVSYDYSYHTMNRGELGVS